MHLWVAVDSTFRHLLQVEALVMSPPLLVHGGPILTMDPEHPLVNAVLFENGRVSKVGESAREAGRSVADIDLAGRLACPGLDDAHAHIMGVGFAQDQIDLSIDAASSIDRITTLVNAETRARSPGTWIVGQGYDQALLPERRHPTRADLDPVAPEHPVLLWRSCHHIAVANSAALRLAGLTSATADPVDGTIDRDDHGEPTGVLRESAATSLAGLQPAPGEDEIADALIRGGMEFRKHGVTSATEAGIRRKEEFRAYQRLWADGRLPLRSYLMMIIDETLDELISLGISTGFGDDWLRIGPAKLFADGSIGGRTARMRQPYRDDPENVGIWMIPPDEIWKKVLRAHAAGFQIGIHAIGDAAIEEVLDAYDAAIADDPRPDCRHRIEHCSIVDEGLIDRIARLGVVPIPGTTFLRDMRPVYLENLGPERVRYAYAMKTFAERGIVAAASSDAPVVTVNPLLGIQTMVSRTDRLGDSIWPEEAVSVEDALRAYTWNAAYASFSETVKGAIRPGMLADMTIFGSDLREVDASALAGQHVDVTIADGEVVYER